MKNMAVATKLLKDCQAEEINSMAVATNQLVDGHEDKLKEMSKLHADEIKVCYIFCIILSLS